MTRRTLNLVELCLTIAFWAIPLVGFGVANYIRFRSGYFPEANGAPISYALWTAVVLPVWALVVEKSRLNRAETIMTFRTGIRAIGKAVSYTMIFALLIAYFYRHALFSGIFAFTGCALTFLLSLLTLHVFRAVLRSRRGPFKTPLRIAILGAEGHEVRVARHLESAPLPVKVACVISVDPSGQPERKWPTLDYQRAEDAVDIYHCNELLVALPARRLSDLQELLRPLRHLCIPVRVVPDIGDGFLDPQRMFTFYGLPLLDVRPYPVDTMTYFVGKRIFDVAFSALILLFASPLIVLIALAIKLTSPGPVFFAQERVGLSGRRFKMFKFRTMHVQDSGSSNTSHTSRNDLRITSLGRLLRNTSLDEIPQFFNVFKSDMSVVGPRPELTFFVQQFRQEIPSYMERHNVKCGITGLAQINGFRGSDTSISRRIEEDLYYLQNWSLFLDLSIIVRTIFGGLRSKNAY